MSGKKSHIYNGFSGYEPVALCGKSAMSTVTGNVLERCISIKDFLDAASTVRCQACEKHLRNIQNFFGGKTLSPFRIEQVSMDLTGSAWNTLYAGKRWRDILKKSKQLEKKYSKVEKINVL